MISPDSTARSTTARAARTRSRAAGGNATGAPSATATTSLSASASPTWTVTGARLLESPADSPAETTDLERRLHGLVAVAFHAIDAGAIGGCDRLYKGGALEVHRGEVVTRQSAGQGT